MIDALLRHSAVEDLKWAAWAGLGPAVLLVFSANGIDLVATLQAVQHQRELTEKQLQLHADHDRDVLRAREDRTRALEHARYDAERELERLRRGTGSRAARGRRR